MFFIQIHDLLLDNDDNTFYCSLFCEPFGDIDVVAGSARGVSRGASDDTVPTAHAQVRRAWHAYIKYISIVQTTRITAHINFRMDSQSTRVNALRVCAICARSRKCV